jgi:superfamily II DNA/RNA helicase
VHYLPDDLVYTIDEDVVPVQRTDAMERFWYNDRDHRMVASIMEEKHVRIFQTLVGPDGYIYDHVLKKLLSHIGGVDAVLIFCAHATVALALSKTFDRIHLKHGLVTGAQTTAQKHRIIERFRNGLFPVLIGTATLATGTDGLDKMCDWLVILDDTEDDAMRRQLIGRIMPRGQDTDASGKHVVRVLQQ